VWAALWGRLGARSDPRPLHATIERAYAEPHRHYHTLAHVGRVLEWVDEVLDQLHHPDEAKLAVWLHDVVYDPRATDNEERSAVVAETWLDAARLPEEMGTRVRGLILATRHATPPEEHDARYVVDADLAILGADPGAFDRYEAQVRQEHAFRPEAEWRERRARLLRGFLDRPRLYLTPEFAALEAPARANLERSLRRLSNHPSEEVTPCHTT
jgi:predicted metal-dependent HD superfamily phosphohydrolase